MSGSVEVQRFLQRYEAGDGARGSFDGVPTQRGSTPDPPRVSDDQVRRARISVAQGAFDAEDCALLLDMLGLVPDDDGRPPVQR